MFDWINPLLFGKSSAAVKAKVEIYTWQICPYCIAAKGLLLWKGVHFTEYKIDGDDQARKIMAERSHGKRSMPQIFINNEHIGGCDDLFALEQQGQLTLRLQR